MSYEHPTTGNVLIRPRAAFGATTESVQFKGPKGMKGYVRDICVTLTAAAVGTTTVPEITVGTAQGSVRVRPLQTRYDRDLGLCRAGVYPSLSHRRRPTSTGNSSFEDFAGHVKMSTLFIPADATFFISRVAGVGGAPAGTGASFVIIDWF